VDEFGALLLLAGLPADRLTITLPPGPEVSPALAAGIRVRLRMYPATTAQYGPRQAVLSILRQVEAMGRPELREHVASRVQRYATLYAFRPDGCLVPVLSVAQAWGNLCLGPLEVRGNQLVADEFVVGGFYEPHGAGWHRIVMVPSFEEQDAQTLSF
jgi:hypothetical protein